MKRMSNIKLYNRINSGNNKIGTKKLNGTNDTVVHNEKVSGQRIVQPFN